jgi:hypothetical protein
VFDEGCVEGWEKVGPYKSAIVIVGSRKDVSNKVLVMDKPARPKDILDVED